MLGHLQRIGKALLLPVAVLPAATLLLRLGQPDLLNIPFISAAGEAIFTNLALLFAIGVAVGLSKDGSGSAALSGAVGYFVLANGLSAMNEEIHIGALGGILSGIIAAGLYNRFSEMKLPEWLGFFGGNRFVPIVTSFTMLLFAAILGHIWLGVQDLLRHIGEGILNTGAMGVGVFGVLNRLLVYVGLHHILNIFVWFELGEFVTINGEIVKGDLPRYFAGDPEAGSFLVGFFPVMMFGLPAVAIAMLAASKKEHRKAAAGALLSMAFTSFLTGITEPIEFLFMFLAPGLYVVHALLTGLAFIVTYSLDIHHGFGFSAGSIDYLLNYGISQNPNLLLAVGSVFAALYFVIFFTAFKKIEFRPPGLEEDDKIKEEERYSELAKRYLEAIGGRDNIIQIDYCITRLRLKVNSVDTIDEEKLKKLGARGIIKLSDVDLQVVVGTKVEFLAIEMKRLV